MNRWPPAITRLRSRRASCSAGPTTASRARRPVSDRRDRRRSCVDHERDIDGETELPAETCVERCERCSITRAASIACAQAVAGSIAMPKTPTAPSASLRRQTPPPIGDRRRRSPPARDSMHTPRRAGMRPSRFRSSQADRRAGSRPRVRPWVAALRGPACAVALASSSGTTLIGADGSQLAGEPDVQRGADAFERALLVQRGRRALREAAHHAHATRRAARIASAHRKMRYPEAAARLQYRPAPRNFDRAVRIGDRHQRVVPALDAVADCTRSEYESDQREVAEQACRRATGRARSVARCPPLPPSFARRDR